MEKHRNPSKTEPKTSKSASNGSETASESSFEATQSLRKALLQVYGEGEDGLLLDTQLPTPPRMLVVVGLHLAMKEIQRFSFKTHDFNGFQDVSKAFKSSFWLQRALDLHLSSSSSSGVAVQHLPQLAFVRRPPLGLTFQANSSHKL